MTIEPLTITISELYDGYINTDETNDVKGYGGKLNIRPAFQREFVYNDKQEKSVINSILNGYPINLFYWAKKESNNTTTYELLDGQQRTLSICRYLSKVFSIYPNNKVDSPKYFNNLTKEEKDKILNYKLEIKVFSGTDKEKLAWFEVINTVGVKLREQEMRNCIYNGSWVSLVKIEFSKQGKLMDNLFGDYIKGERNRQDYLEKALSWISNYQNISIVEYMAKHQNDTNIDEIVSYIKSVHGWLTTLFPKYRKEMKGVEWGILYNEYHIRKKTDTKLNSIDIETKISKLLKNDTIKKRSGVYEYVLDYDNPNREKHLDIRAFTENMRLFTYEKQNGKCGHCGKKCEISELEAHHIKEWFNGGTTTAENCILLCKDCHRKETSRLLKILP